MNRSSPKSGYRNSESHQRSPDRAMPVRAYMLDIVADGLGNCSGIVYGIQAGRSDRRNIIISSLECRPGLTAVASLDGRKGLPRLEPDGCGSWALTMDGGPRVPVQEMRWSHDYAARLAGVIDASALGTQRAVIVGTGSVGSPIALHLTRAGIGSLILCDPDRVELVNLCRSGFTVDQIGLPKVEALAQHALLANPAIDLRLFPCEYSDALDEHPDAFEGADVIISCATNAVGFRIAADWHRRVPIIYPALHRRAASGEIFVSLGAAQACFACYRKQAHRAAEERAPSWNYDSAEGELTAEPGLGADISVITSVASSIAINILAGAADRALGGNLLLVGNRAGAMFDAPFETRWADVTRDPACPYHDERSTLPPDEPSILDTLPEATP